MVKKMENKTEEKKISKVKMFFKFTKLFLYKIVKRKWYIPAVSEMTVDQLNDRINSKLSPKGKQKLKKKVDPTRFSNTQ